LQPATLEDMHERLNAEHNNLSKRLKEVSAYIQKNPQSLAVDTAAVIAEKAGVHASTLVRFANHFGFTGFTQLQQLYKDHVHRNYQDYGERIRRNRQSPGNSAETAADLLQEFTEANRLALSDLQTRTDPQQLDQAVSILQQATAIHICGLGRAFPVSMYFAYILSNMQIKCHAISGLGMMHDAPANNISPGDALIAITFSPYSDTTRSIIDSAATVGAKIILITGEEDCPSANVAEAVFRVPDAEVRSFRSLTSTLCLAQTLCIALGYRTQGNKPS